MVAALISEDFSLQIIESIEVHQRNADKLSALSLGEPVKTYARILVERINDDVIPALHFALYCNQTLMQLSEEGIAQDIDPVLFEQLYQGIQTILLWPEFAEVSQHEQ